MLTLVLTEMLLTLCISHYEEIEVENSGFEEDHYPVEENTYEYTYPAPIGWDKYNPVNVTSDWDIGVQNPKGSTEFDDLLFGDSCPEGNQCAWVDQWESVMRGKGEFGIYQTLWNYEVEVDTTYTLRVWVGNGAGNTWSNNNTYDGTGFPGYRVELLANDDILADDNDDVDIPEGTWRQSVVSATVTAGNPHIGKTLGIRLMNKNIDHGHEGGMEIIFDDVMLAADHDSDEDGDDDDDVNQNDQGEDGLDQGDPGYKSKGGGGAVAAVIIILLLLLIVGVVVFCYYRRKNKALVKIGDVDLEDEEQEMQGGTTV